VGYQNPFDDGDADCSFSSDDVEATNLGLEILKGKEKVSSDGTSTTKGKSKGKGKGKEKIKPSSSKLMATIEEASKKHQEAKLLTQKHEQVSQRNQREMDAAKTAFDKAQAVYEKSVKELSRAKVNETQKEKDEREARRECEQVTAAPSCQIMVMDALSKYVANVVVCSCSNIRACRSCFRRRLGAQARLRFKPPQVALLAHTKSLATSRGTHAVDGQWRLPLS
jgi:hypothetical protein